MSWSDLYGTGGGSGLSALREMRLGCGDEGVLGEVLACGFCATWIRRSIIACAISEIFISINAMNAMNIDVLISITYLGDLGLVFETGFPIDLASPR